MKLLSSVLLAAIATVRVSAVGIPNSVNVFQIQPPPGAKGALPRTPCLAPTFAQDGEAVRIDDCTAFTELRAWHVLAGGSTSGAGTPGMIVLFNTLCLQPQGPVQDGVGVQLNTCNGQNPAQLWQWNSNGTVNVAGSNQCLTRPNGEVENGIQMTISTCVDGNKDQIWSANTLQSPVRELAALNDGLKCMGANSSANGAPVFITSCLDTTTRKVWSLPQAEHGNHGSFRLAFGDFDGSAPIKCLDVTNGVAAPGTKLQLWDCVENSTNQDFFPTLSNTVQWEGSTTVPGLCLDMTASVAHKGSPITLQTCQLNNGNQLWSENIQEPDVI